MELVGEVVILDYGWLRLSKIVGEAGTTTVTLTAIADNTARSARTKTITGTTTMGRTAQCVVTQQAAAEFVKMDTEFCKIGDGESQIVLTGESNASALNMQLGNNASGVSISSIEISDDGGTSWKTITNDAAITGDPGSLEKYKFRVTLSVNNFAFSTGNYVYLTARGADIGVDETGMHLPETSFFNSEEEYSLSDSDPLTIIGTSDSASLTLGGSLATLSCTMYISFDSGATWTSYTAGTAISNDSINKGGHYLFKVVVDTSSLPAETADMTLNVYDNTGTMRASEDVSFTE